MDGETAYPSAILFTRFINTNARRPRPSSVPGVNPMASSARSVISAEALGFENNGELGSWFVQIRWTSVRA